MEAKDKLIEKMKELVAFYGEIISGYAVYLHVHNIHESEENIEKGKSLRDEIAALEQIADSKEIPAGAETMINNEFDKWKEYTDNGMSLFGAMITIKEHLIKVLQSTPKIEAEGKGLPTDEEIEKDFLNEFGHQPTSSNTCRLQGIKWFYDKYIKQSLPKEPTPLRDELIKFVKYLNDVKIFDQKYVVDNYLNSKEK